MGSNYYKTEGFEKKIQFREDPELEDHQKELVIKAIQKYIDDDWNWNGFIDMIATNGKNYMVYISENTCHHCKTLDIRVTMGVCGNYVARLSLHSVPEDEATEDEDPETNEEGDE